MSISRVLEADSNHPLGLKVVKHSVGNLAELLALVTNILLDFQNGGWVVL